MYKCLVMRCLGAVVNTRSHNNFQLFTHLKRLRDFFVNNLTIMSSLLIALHNNSIN